MLSYEKYEKNIYIDDKYSIKDINIDKCFTYKGDIELLDRANTEDSNFQMPPLAAAVVGIDNTAAPLPQNLDSLNLWTEIDAQEAYLNTKPASYLIIGKPGLGSYTLGESLSKKLNSIHLSPRSVLLEEIEQKSQLGRCLDFNMRHNKVCEFDIILAIMQTKIKSSVIENRGFIISGLPLVTSSKKEQHLLTSLYMEESLVIVDDLLYDLIVNLKRKKAKQKVIKLSPHSSLSSEVDNAEEQEIEEEQQPEIETEEIEELSVEMPKYLLDSCSDVIISHKIFFMTKKAVLLQQLLELFNFKPDIVIHVMSPDTDTISKKSRKFFNYFNNLNTFNPFIQNIESEIRWPNKYTMIDYSNPHDSHVFNPKYNIKLPINFKSNSLSQICNYTTYINPFIDQKFKDFDPCYILKVDGRTSVYQMLNYILGKLLLMPIQLVLIPKPLYLEEPPEDLEELWNTIKEFNTIKSGVLNFNRYASLWNTRCPVELMKRRSVQGKSKLAVSLFKYVFLLSSLDAMISFCKNPRPFLKLEYLEPTCRIIIMGTKSTGKSMIANCLSWLFDTSIICYKDFLNNERQKKYDSFSKSILSEIIATIEDARLMKWQSAEEERISNLNKWVINVQAVLQNYISLMEKYQEPTEEENVIPEIDLQKMDLLSKQLSFLPILDDLELCKESILNTDLINYAPLELTTETATPKVPILGDEDVVEAISSYIVANELQKDIEPTAEELMNEMTQIITTIDYESLEKNEKYGKFIIDGLPCNTEFWGYLDTAKLLPDYTIVLIENKEIDIELLKTYAIIDKSIKNYEERYTMSSDPLVKLKKRHKMPSKNTSLDIDMILNELINGVFELVVTEDQFVDNTAEMIGPFNEAIDKFREEWDSVKLKLEENWKAVIIVEMENRSDIDIVDEVLLKLRQSYCLSCTPSDSSEMDEKDDEYNAGHDMLTYNDSCYFGETNIYCPIAYYDYGVIWEGKSEFCTQFDNKSYYFCKEEYLDLFQKDVTKYQSYNKPFKSLPPLRISIIGSIGSGKSTLSKQIAKELGLIHIDFAEFLNSYLLPKHFKKVGRQYENSFKDTPIDNEAVMEFQVGEENDKMVADILGNESEIRLVLYNYFEKGVPFISPLMQRAIRFLWHTSPFSKIGIVLDGFPKLPSDFEDMIACSCIPDIIIDLQGSSEKTLERLSPKMFKKWKMQLNEAKNEVKMKFEKERKQWLEAVTKEIVLKLIIDEILNNIFTDMVINDINPEQNTSIHSTIIDAHPSGSANVDVNLFNTYNEVIQANPEPVDESQWEKAEDALERINTRLESIFEIDDENIQMLKENLEENKVKNESVNGMKSAIKVFKKVLSIISFLRNRNESFFEQTFILSCDIAETLLMEGFYLLSKFNRMCPVYIFENAHVISNPYHMCKRMNKLFPVIHRSYIYFLSSISNVQKFRRNPLKYINSENIKSYREFPLRIGIIGPPKCGKSYLASKLSKRYGLLCISRGQAIRQVLENMAWSELACKMNKKLQLGECIDSELIMNAVHTVTIDFRVVTNGLIFDGFPELPVEATELLKLGLYPLIVIHIDSNSSTVLRNSQDEIYDSLIKFKPPYSRSFIEHRNTRWHENFPRIEGWINDDVQNLQTVNGNASKWQCLRDATQYIEDTISKVNYYLLNVKSKIVPAGVMCFSNEIFEQRMSPYKNNCAICLQKNVLSRSDFPVDKKGLVQFGNYLYWLCPDHMEIGLSYPDKFLEGKINIPEIPVAVKAVSPALLYEDGICMVTYTENLPSQRVVRGDENFAASYCGRYYIFCNSKCLRKFLAKPQRYYNISVFKEASIFPKMSLKKLPNLGYLEQTLGNILTRACCYINVTRPKYPGLDIEVSGLLHVALYLKIHNSRIAKPVLEKYEKAYKKYEARCRLIHDISLRLRSMDNPFAKYPKRCGKLNTGTVSKSSSIISSLKSFSDYEFGLVE